MGLMFEPGSYTESIGERSLQTAEKKVETHPWVHARWHERISRQVERNPVPEWAKVKPTSKTNDGASPEADA